VAEAKPGGRHGLSAPPQNQVPRLPGGERGSGASHDVRADTPEPGGAGFHTFRYTCASMLFAEGRNAVQVQRWLGDHSAAFTLATYVCLTATSASRCR
jgi:integrase